MPRSLRENRLAGDYRPELEAVWRMHIVKTVSEWLLIEPGGFRYEQTKVAADALA